MLTMTSGKVCFLTSAEDRHLAKMTLFKSCSGVDLLQIEKYMVEKRFAKNQSIFSAEEPAEMIWFVKTGYVKEVEHSLRGRSQIVSLVGADGMFGTSAFGGGEYDCYAFAETKADVLAFPIRVFQSFLDKHAALGRAVLYQFSKYLLEAKKMQAFAVERVEKRILHALVRLKDQFGATIRLTRKEIGEVAGANTETVIRVFSRLEAKGLVRTGRGQVIVSDVNKLLIRMREL